MFKISLSYKTFDYVIQRIKESSLMCAREKWFDKQLDKILKNNIWIPMCIFLKDGKIVFQDRSGLITDYIPTEEDKRATDWYII